MSDKSLQANDLNNEGAIEVQASVDTTPTLKQVLIMIAVLICCAFGFIAISALEDARAWETEDIVLAENSGVSCTLQQPVMGEYITFNNCYAEIPGEYISSWDVTVVLKARDSAKGIYIPTYMPDSAMDINTYHRNEGNYVRTAFSANVAANKLSLDNTDYDILIYYNNNDRDIYVDTGMDLTKEGLR